MIGPAAPAPPVRLVAAVERAPDPPEQLPCPLFPFAATAGRAPPDPKGELPPLPAIPTVPLNRIPGEPGFCHVETSPLDVPVMFEPSEVSASAVPPVCPVPPNPPLLVYVTLWITMVESPPVLPFAPVFAPPAPPAPSAYAPPVRAAFEPGLIH